MIKWWNAQRYRLALWWMWRRAKRYRCEEGVGAVGGIDPASREHIDALKADIRRNWRLFAGE